MAIQTRSPTLLITGGASLLIDSMINFAIQLTPHDNIECILGIITTVTNYYLGWACIALRVWRVKAVFDAYDGYLQLLKKEEKILTNDSFLQSVGDEMTEDLASHRKSKESFSKRKRIDLSRLAEL